MPENTVNLLLSVSEQLSTEVNLDLLTHLRVQLWTQETLHFSDLVNEAASVQPGPRDAALNQWLIRKITGWARSFPPLPVCLWETSASVSRAHLGLCRSGAVLSFRSGSLFVQPSTNPANKWLGGLCAEENKRPGPPEVQLRAAEPADSVRTFVAEVVHQDDLCDELRRRAVEHAVDGPEQRRPALVVERDDDAGVGQLLCVQLLSAAANTHTGSCYKRRTTKINTCFGGLYTFFSLPAESVRQQPAFCCTAASSADLGLGRWWIIQRSDGCVLAPTQFDSLGSNPAVIFSKSTAQSIFYRSPLQRWLCLLASRERTK